ncbi:MAG: tetratricopeptide repeat protein [Bacteroidia bacterium]
MFLLSGFVVFTNIIFAQEIAQSGDEKSTNFVNQGLDKASQNDWNGAINYYTLALQQNPKNAVAYYDRATARYNLKDFRGAFMDYSKAINIDPYSSSDYVAGSYYGRGLCFQYLGNKEKACLDFTKANELGNPDAANAMQVNCN